MPDIAVCCLCFKPAAHVHHLTGRDPQRLHLDDDLGVPLCRNHHVYAHELLRSQRLDTPPRRSAWTPTAATAFRLQRLGVFFAMYATFHDGPLWPLLAASLRDWPHELNPNPAKEPTP